MTMSIEADDDLDLNPEADAADEAPIELTREQQLSRLSLRELQLICKRPEYNLSAAGRTTELIARIVKFEEEGMIDGPDLAADPKPGVAPTPVEPTTIPGAPGGGTSAGVPPAPTPADPPTSGVRSAIRPAKQKVGYFEATNTFRAEFPLGPRAQIDDPTHFQFIADTHTAAREAGYAPRGGETIGTRAGFSVIRTDSGPMRSVIYEVHVRQPE